MKGPCRECGETRAHLHGEFTMRDGSISTSYVLPVEAMNEVIRRACTSNEADPHARFRAIVDGAPDLAADALMEAVAKLVG